MKQISIIVPVYNGELYLERCIDSILAQTVIGKIRALLLDDGSKDGSLEIIKKYKKLYPEAIEIYSHNNIGAAKTHNKGMDLVESQYFMFVDQDDWIEPEICEKLLDEIEKKGADISACGMRRVSGEKVLYSRGTNNSTWYKYQHTEPWAKLYKTSFVRAAKATMFDDNFGFDVGFLLELLAANPKFETLDYIGYDWYDAPTAITATVHKKFEDIHIEKLLTKINSISKEPLNQFYLVNIAVFGLLYSQTRARHDEFAKNCTKTLDFIVKLSPKILDNEYLNKAPDGMSAMNAWAIKLVVRGYKNQNYRLAFLIFQLAKRKLERK